MSFARIVVTDHALVLWVREYTLPFLSRQANAAQRRYFTPGCCQLGTELRHIGSGELVGRVTGIHSGEVVSIKPLRDADLDWLANALMCDPCVRVPYKQPGLGLSATTLRGSGFMVDEEWAR